MGQWAVKTEAELGRGWEEEAGEMRGAKQGCSPETQLLSLPSQCLASVPKITVRSSMAAGVPVSALVGKREEFRHQILSPV